MSIAGDVLDSASVTVLGDLHSADLSPSVLAQAGSLPGRLPSQHTSGPVLSPLPEGRVSLWTLPRRAP